MGIMKKLFGEKKGSCCGVKIEEVKENQNNCQPCKTEDKSGETPKSGKGPCCGK